MKTIIQLGTLIIGLIVLFAHGIFSQQKGNFIKGITIAGPPTSVSIDAFQELKNVNAEWVCLVPFGYSSINSTTITYDMDSQWWGETKKGIIQSIKMAHKIGLKVMLKPQIYIHGDWVGNVDFSSEIEWLNWEKEYRKFITSYSQIAKQHNVELFCIGTEYKIAAQKRPQFWKSIIKYCRENYSGKLTYSSNWDGYDNIPFWDQLDFIGISSYFPLTEKKTPSIYLLRKKWKPIRTKLREFANKHQKQVLFTEYGYQSVDGCAWKAWEIEKQLDEKEINENAQANAINAILVSFSKESYWAGGFLWKWFLEGLGHEGYPEKDYTPQNKKAEKILKRRYTK